MRGPTAALLWEIWRQHRSTVVAIAVLTVIGRSIDVLETRGRTGGADIDSSPLTTLLGMVAFLLLFAVFNYTESSGGRGVGQFPRRLFTLPVTSLRLVAVPVLAGISSIELLYLSWMGPLSRGGAASTPFVAILLAAFVVFYLWVLWTLERAGSLRLVMLGVIAVAVFALGVLPSFPPTPPPSWRSEAALIGLVAGLAVVAFLLTWRHVGRLRAGGARSAHRAESLFGWIAEASPARRRPFATPAAAHFWFEWRCSGVVLPVLVGGVVVAVIAPMSWVMRRDGGDTLRLLLGALATPVVLALPVGAAFSKPRFWSEDLAVPAFVAVRPLSADDLVATKVKAAAASAALSWLVLLSFVAVWLSLWGNLDSLSQLAVQLWAFHGRSVAAVYGIAALVVIVGMLLTWRFMVSRLWSGLSGRRRLFLGSVVSIGVIAIAASDGLNGGVVFDAGGFSSWLLDDPARLAPIAWLAALGVIAKYWMAAYAWRGVAQCYVRAYLLIWLAGTTAFLALGLVLWGIVRIYLPLDSARLRSVVILLGLMAVPLARVGLATSRLARNRHR